MKCNFCKELIPDERVNAPNRPKTGSKQLKYCSSLCMKRAWYLRVHKPKRSIFNGNPDTGIAWEEWFIKSFGATRPSRSLNTAVDFIWNGDNIDLKVCTLWKRKRKRGKDLDIDKQSGVWVFNRNKIKDNVDFFICIALVDGNIHKTFKIPSDKAPRTGMTIGFAKSKYDKYLFD